MLETALRAFHLAPKNVLSYVTGCVVRAPLPKPLSTISCKGFAALFRLNMAEAAAPIGSYATIEELFTRPLKPGLRPIAPPVCSPADGYLARSEPISAGQAVQAKGLSYDVTEFLYGTDKPPSGTEPRFTWLQTIYLAPHNYHRVHAPFSGTVTRLAHIPGELWPVNNLFVSRIPRLFSRNERLVFTFALPSGGKAHVVMVGAFNVGRMVTPLAPGLITNNSRQSRSTAPATLLLTPPRSVTIGDEIGTFMLGSTVVIIYEEDAFPGIKLVQASDNRPILMGQTLCA